MTSTSAKTADPSVLLECRRIRKAFGGTLALRDVDFSIRAGETHGLVGSNGAGKSTLMRILAGALPSYEGEVVLEGTPIELRSPRDAASRGLAMVYQELSGIGQLSVAENLFLGRQPLTRWGTVDWNAMRDQASRLLREMRIDVDVRRRLDRYPLVVRQMVEIARVLHSGARILILDEPTSALSPPETRRLFELLRELQARGVSIIFISHFLEDVLEICQRVTVLRDGQNVGTFATADLTKQDIVHAMLGRGLESEEVGYQGTVTLPPRSAKDAAFRVEGLTREPLFRDVSFEIAPGECLGIYGFVGAGHQELVQAVAGALRPNRGSIRLDAGALPLGSVHAAVRRGVVFVAGDRARTLVRPAPIFQNTTLAHLRAAVGNWLTRGAEVRASLPVLERVSLRPLEPRLPVAALSGGNQQKVVLAKWLLGPMRLLVMDEPTRGMDVGAKEEILKLVRELQSQGVMVLIASTEPELLLTHADRILVMQRGRITAEFAGVSVDRGQLMKAA